MKMLKGVYFSFVILIILIFNNGVDARIHGHEMSFCVRLREPDPEVSSLAEAFKPFVATVNQYPFMVSIHLMGTFKCGGVLYWLDLVLTSVSCIQLLYNNRFYRENPRVLTVRVASNYSDTGGQVFEATEIFFHPAYDPRTLAYNIAVIRLRHQVVSRGHNIPKCLDMYNLKQAPPSNVIVFMLGWGDHYDPKRDPHEKILNPDENYLAKRYLPIVTNYHCKDIYGKNAIIDPMFCAGTMTHPSGACNHDAGGPAIMDGQLVGIISHGYPVCDTPNKPTVFTHIGHVYEWLERIKLAMNSYVFKDPRSKKRTTCFEVTDSTQSSQLNTDSDDTDKGNKGNDDVEPIDPDKGSHETDEGSKKIPGEETDTKIAESEKKSDEATAEEAKEMMEAVKVEEETEAAEKAAKEDNAAEAKKVVQSEEAAEAGHAAEALEASESERVVETEDATEAQEEAVEAP